MTKQQIAQALFETIKELGAIDISIDDFSEHGEPLDNTTVDCCNAAKIVEMFTRHLNS